MDKYSKHLKHLYFVFGAFVDIMSLNLFSLNKHLHIYELDYEKNFHINILPPDITFEIFFRPKADRHFGTIPYQMPHHLNLEDLFACNEQAVLSFVDNHIVSYEQ